MSETRGQNIAVLIASSRTGREIIQESLKRGHTVQAVIRAGSEAKFRASIPKSVYDDPSLTVHDCDPDSVEGIAAAIYGTQAVFVATGGFEISKPAYYNQNLVTTILASLDMIEVSRRPGRLVLLSSERCNPINKERHPWMHWLVAEKLMKPVVEDLAQTESILKKHKHKIAYTFLQAGTIVDAPGTDSRIHLVDYTDNALISYRDLAIGMLDAGFDQKYSNSRKGVISEGKTQVTWAGSKTARSVLGEILWIWVFQPVSTAAFLIGLGYLLGIKMRL